VVYVAAEGVTGLRKRLRALERHHGQKVPHGMLTVIRRPVHLEREEEVAALRQVIEDKGAGGPDGGPAARMSRTTRAMVAGSST
jgi:hypothetical protein